MYNQALSDNTTILSSHTSPSNSHAHTQSKRKHRRHHHHHHHHTRSQHTHTHHRARNPSAPLSARLVFKLRLTILTFLTLLVLFPTFLGLTLTKTLRSTPLTIITIILLLILFMLFTHSLIRYFMLRQELRRREERKREKGGVRERGWDISWPRPVFVAGKEQGVIPVWVKGDNEDVDVERGEEWGEDDDVSDRQGGGGEGGFVRSPGPGTGLGNSVKGSIRMPPPVYGNYRDSVRIDPFHLSQPISITIPPTPHTPSYEAAIAESNRGPHPFNNINPIAVSAIPSPLHVSGNHDYDDINNDHVDHTDIPMLQPTTYTSSHNATGTIANAHSCPDSLCPPPAPAPAPQAQYPSRFSSSSSSRPGSSSSSCYNDNTADVEYLQENDIPPVPPIPASFASFITPSPSPSAIAAASGSAPAPAPASTSAEATHPPVPPMLLPLGAQAEMKRRGLSGTMPRHAFPPPPITTTTTNPHNYAYPPTTANQPPPPSRTALDLRAGGSWRPKSYRSQGGITEVLSRRRREVEERLGLRGGEGRENTSTGRARARARGEARPKPRLNGRGAWVREKKSGGGSGSSVSPKRQREDSPRTQGNPVAVGGVGAKLARELFGEVRVEVGRSASSGGSSSSSSASLNSRGSSGSFGGSSGGGRGSAKGKERGKQKQKAWVREKRR